MTRTATVLLLAGFASTAVVLIAATPEVLSPIAALPVAVTSSFAEPIAFAETTSGQALVLDLHPAALWSVDVARKSAKQLVGSGPSPSGLTLPAALAVGPNDFIAVADVVNDVNRIQYFTPGGQRLGGFYLPDRPRAHVTFGSLPLNGISSMAMAATSLVVNLPSRGWLISEVSLTGETIRQFGEPRSAGSSTNADVAALLNIGIPLVDPTGGFYFVFQTGLPIFRKYDASGRLIFERHIEGLELDAALGKLPTEWRLDGPNAGMPIAAPLVRTASVDRAGHLWISLAVPYTYVYDAGGDKIRTVQFGAGGRLIPRSLFFATRDRLLVTPGCYEFAAK